MKKFSTCIALLYCVLMLPAQMYFDILYGEDENSDLSDSKAFQLSDSSFLFCAYSFNNHFGVEGKADIFRLDSEGNAITHWQLAAPGFDYYLSRGIRTAAEDFIVTGAVTNLDTDTTSLFLMQISQSTDTVWYKNLQTNAGFSYPTDILQTSDMGYIFTAMLLYYDTNGYLLDEQVLAIRTDSMGEELWRKTYGSPVLRERVLGIAPTNDGGFLLAGYSRQPYFNGDFQAMIIKINHLGQQQWEKKYGQGSKLEAFYRIIQSMDGNFVVAGSVGVRASNGTISSERQWLVKLSPQGHILWEQRYPEASSGTWLWDLVELPDGAIVAAGALKGPPSNSQSGFILKTTPEGEPIWSHRYDRHPGYIDLFYSINTTLDGGFVLTGFARRPDSSTTDAWILKVDSSGCSEPGCIEITSTEEPEAPPGGVDDFRLWPNPASDYVWVERLQPIPAGEGFVVVFDASGRQVFKTLLDPGAAETRLSIAGLPSGLYYCTLAIEGQSPKTKPFLIIR
jgi:hypothetical protein